MNVVRHLESVATTPSCARRTTRPAASSRVLLEHGSERGVVETDQGLRANRGGESRSAGPAATLSSKKTIDDFRRHGAELDAAGQEATPGNRRRADEADHQVLAERAGFDQRLRDGADRRSRARRAAASSAVRRRAQSAAGEGHQEGWRFTFRRPSYIAVMTYLDDRDIRARKHVPRLQPPRRGRGPHDNRDDHCSHSRAAQGEGPAAGLPRFRRSGAGRSHGAHRRKRAQKFLGDLRRRPSRVSARRISELRTLRRAKTNCSPGMSATGPKSSARLCTISTKKRCGRTSRSSASSTGMFEIFGRMLGIRRASRNPACRVWDPAVKVLRDSGRERRNASARSTPTGIRARTSAAAPGWIR